MSEACSIDELVVCLSDFDGSVGRHINGSDGIYVGHSESQKKLNGSSHCQHGKGIIHEIHALRI